MRNTFARGAAALSLALVSGAVMAQGGGVDTTAALASIADAKTAVLAIGLAVFGVMVGVKIYKWARRAL